MAKLVVGILLLLLLVVGAFRWFLPQGQEPAPPPCAPVSGHPGPVKIAVLHDVSASVKTARVAALHPADFAPLIELLFRAGGELRVGLIQEDSDQPLLALSIVAPPACPLAPHSASNLFESAQSQDVYATQLAQYQQDLQQWHRTANQRVAAFNDELARRLSRPPTAQRSDIWGAVARASLFLSEAVGTPDASPRFLLLLSDGRDNVKKPAAALPAGVSVYLVNGAGSLGSLARLQPRRFEALPAAIRALVLSITQPASAAPTTASSSPALEKNR